jgi:ubiquinone/menaquinone biosynthesis C-methylase UbiE
MEETKNISTTTLQWIQETYNEIATEFDITRYKPWPQTVEFVNGLEDGNSILDLGCGNGRNTIYIGSLNRDFRIIALDFSIRMLRLVRNKVKAADYSDSVELILGDAVKLPFTESSIDSILYVATLHHLPTKEQRLSSVLELQRCLKPGGKAFIGVWDFEQERFSKELEKQLNQPPVKGEFGDVLVPWTGKRSSAQNRFYHLFYKDELENLLKQTKLKIVDIYRASDNYHALVEKS